MVAYHYDANTILAQPLKNRQAASITEAWEKINACFEFAAVKPSTCILDNEASQDLKTALNKKGIKQYFVGNGISLEQIILDFHSGAIFKKEGKLFFDLISLLLIFLSVSGIWIWFIKRKKGGK